MILLKTMLTSASQYQMEQKAVKIVSSTHNNKEEENMITRYGIRATDL